MIEDFHIRVDDAVLDDLHRRLAHTRLPDQIEDTGWDYGIPVDYLGELVAYWRDTYDWRAQEAQLNELAHFRTVVDGQSIHFVHARSPHTAARPLLLTHGWPGSIVEFLDVIPRLTEPEAHGGVAADAFHVVAPSLPGYGFSERTRTRGWDAWRIARAFAELMHRLGYARYGAQGGDWGAQVTTRLAAFDPEHCAAIHLNMAIARPPEDAVPLTDEDKADLAAMQRFQREESGYANEQSTKPQTLGVALNDSPAGLLAWIVENEPAIEGVLDEATTVDGPVVVRTGARVEASTLRGPLVIDEGSTVVGSTIGPDVSIGPGCRIEASEVADSIVMEECTIADVHGLTGSILGRHVEVRHSGGSGAHRLIVGDQSRIEVD